MVMLVPEEGPLGGRGGGRGGGLGAVMLGGGFRSMTRQDGTFSIANVTPGQVHDRRARRRRAERRRRPRTASQPLVVAGEEVNVVLTTAPGVALSGSA